MPAFRRSHAEQPGFWYCSTLDEGAYTYPESPEGEEGERGRAVSFSLRGNPPGESPAPENA